MTSKFIIKRNRYVDSVSLMSVTDSVKKADGIENCNASMVTAANREILEGLGFDIPADVGANDLVVAVIASDEAAADAALALGQDLLDHKNAASGGKTYDNIEDIDLDEDPYDLVQISLPGEYAAAEAEKALKKGLDVFMFSDNVSLEDEKRLKELAITKGVLMMGPDCGVGYLKGVGLAAGSCYHTGCVGIVGASGSGAQEVGCLVEKLGFGISSLIGTGGRDLYPEIGGIMMLEGIRRLERDPDTKIIILVSKLADLTVMNKVLSFADIVSKPVVAIFLGADEKLYEGHRVYGTYSLEGAAVKAAQLLGAKTHDFGFTDEQIKEIVAREMRGYSAKQKYFRGLYCGGTFTEEGLIYYRAGCSAAAYMDTLSGEPADCTDEMSDAAATVNIDALRAELTKIVGGALGVIREAGKLEQAKTELERMLEQIPESGCYAQQRLRNDTLTAYAVTLAALERKTSTGCHVRTDSAGEPEKYRVNIRCENGRAVPRHAEI